MSGDTIFLLVGAAAFVGAWIYTGKGPALGGGSLKVGRLLRQLDAAVDEEAWNGTGADMAADRRAALRRKLAETLDPKGDPPRS